MKAIKTPCREHRHLCNRYGEVRHLHFVGVGGAGMGGIAEVMHRIGYRVSGSDAHEGAMTQRLREQGIAIHIGHDAELINGCDAVVVSTAISRDNAEVQAAQAQRIPILRRAEMLAELMRFRRGIAIAGTHGKTTTTSLVASILAEGGLDPTFVIGGKLNSAGTHAALGEGEYLVAEADESDASFLLLHPVMSVVTNIDADHMETYGGSFANLRNAFHDFLQQLPFYGLAVLCQDDPTIQQLRHELSKPVLTYGLAPEADVIAHDIHAEGCQTHFKVSRWDAPNWLDVTLNLPGQHNVRNALAAICIAFELGVEDDTICRALAGFQGIGRRLQVSGQFDCEHANDVLLIDDYGHHPRELTATLEAIRAGWPARRLVVVFQPHRYTRTRDLFSDFVEVLSQIDVLLLLDVYPAGEAPIFGADGMSLFRAIQPCCAGEIIFVEQPTHVAAQLKNVLRDGDVLVTLGAGSVGALATELPVALGFGL
jgi:UDP-N-acetylmuramate--alanine ligase